MTPTIRTLRRSAFAGCLLLAACATVAASQSGAVSAPSASPRTSASSSTGAPAAAPAPTGQAPAATPPKPRPLADGSYRDLRGNALVPPAAMFGAKIESCPPAVARHLGLDPAKCSILAEVMPGLPAAKAGLEPHDIIVAVQGQSDAAEQTLRQAIRSANPGETIVITVRRGSETRQATVTLEPWHPDHMIRRLHPHHFQQLPALPADGPASAAQVAALEQRVAALEQQVAELRMALGK